MIRRLAAATIGCLLVAATIPAAQAKSDRPRQEKWRESGTVVRIVDGDTFDMAAGEQTIRVRLNGIQAPESKWCGGRAAKKAGSGNAPTGVWRVKRTVHVQRGDQWVDIAPDLLSRGLVFPFPFIGENAHNNDYLKLGWRASRAGVGLYDAAACGPSRSTNDRLKLEVVADGPGPSTGNAEFVMVFNGSRHDINLSGWMVQDTSPLNAFFFPKRSRVRADDFVVVFSGEGERGVAPDGSRDDRYFYAGTGMRWNNDSADIAFLFDDAGKDVTGNLRDWLILTPGP